MVHALQNYGERRFTVQFFFLAKTVKTVKIEGLAEELEKAWKMK